jgi:hypothetical protein
VNIFHAPAFYLIVVGVIGYFLPLVSARLNKERWYTSRPEVEGLFTLIASALTGLAADLIHAATGSADFSWRAWFSAAVAALAGSLAGYIQSWNGSRTAANLRAAGSGKNMHSDANQPPA